jgi:hypothetical protein
MPGTAVKAYYIGVAGAPPPVPTLGKRKRVRIRRGARKRRFEARMRTRR